MSGTSTAFIERASDRSFKADLNAYLDNDAALERRAESIEQYAHDLIQAGQEFYPWTFDHFEEAITNAPGGNRIAVFATIAAAVDLGLENDMSNHMALVAVRQLMDRYWLDRALHHVKGDE